MLTNTWERMTRFWKRRQARRREAEKTLQKNYEATAQLALHHGLDLARWRAEQQSDSWLNDRWRDRERRKMQSGSVSFSELQQFIHEQQRRG